MNEEKPTGWLRKEFERARGRTATVPLHARPMVYPPTSFPQWSGELMGHDDEED